MTTQPENHNSFVNAEAMGSNPVEALNVFFGLKFAIALIAITTAMVKSSFH